MKSKLRHALFLSGLVSSALAQAQTPNKSQIDNVFSDIEAQNPGCRCWRYKKWQANP